MVAPVALTALQRLVEGIRPPVADSMKYCDWFEEIYADYCEFPFSRFHREMGNVLDTIKPGERHIVVAPRGFSKSSFFGEGGTLRKALSCQMRFGLYLGDTQEASFKHVQAIGERLTTPRTQMRYARMLQGAKTTAGRIMLGNGCAIEGFAYRQRLRGMRKAAARPDWIVIDDAENDENVRSEMQRDKLKDIINRVILKMGGPATKVIMIGTMLHPHCVLGKLMKQTGWTAHFYRAIEQWPDRMDLWAEWEQLLHDHRIDDKEKRAENAKEFYLYNRKLMDAGAKVLWPEHTLYNLYALMLERALNGHSHFEHEMQNNPIDPDRCEFPMSWFGPDIWIDEMPPQGTVRAMYLDPAKGRDSKYGDYAALVYVVWNAQEDRIYVDSLLERANTDTLVEHFVDWYKKLRPDICGIEGNAFQDLLKGPIREHARKQGVLINPVIIHNIKPKIARIRQLEPYMRDGMVRYNRTPSNELLVEQLQNFPLADHDDGPDAFDGAMQLVHELIGGDQSGTFDTGIR